MPAMALLHDPGACVTDADLGWHLSSGAWILKHQAFPHADPFSRIHAAPWQAYSWLFELALLKLWQWFNLQGILLFTALLLAALSLSLFRLINRLNGDFTLSALLTMAVMFAVSRMYTPRPWLFTFLFFAIELDILMSVRRSGQIRHIFWLMPIFVAWANVHIQFIDGLLLLGIAACEPLLARWWKTGRAALSAPVLCITFAACTGATLINPYGVGLYRSAWQLATQQGVLNTVSEMQALPFRSASDYLLLFMSFAAAGVLFRDLRLPPFQTLLFAAAAAISFRSQRDLWFMAIVAATILAEALPARAPRVALVRPQAWLSASVAMMTTAAVVFFGALAVHDSEAHLIALQAKSLPLAAVGAVEAANLSGPVFNDYNWGGFLIWKLGQPVTIDGRAALYGDARIDRSRNTWGGAPDWSTDPDLQSASVVIAPVHAPLTRLLRTDSRFSLAYQDAVASVFVPVAEPKGTRIADLRPSEP